MAPLPEQITGFHAEGMAEFMTYGDYSSEYLQNRGWYIEAAFNSFINQYGREPKLADIMPDSNGYMSVYTFGMAFWYYMHNNYADYTTIRDFFMAGCDWNVFDVSYEEIDSGYIYYLKQLAGLVHSNEAPLELPGRFILHQNYPNPFNPVTSIQYELPVECDVTIKLYNILGKEVATLVNEKKLPGIYKTGFDGTFFSSGLYIYRIIAGNYALTKKMILLK